MTRWTVATTLAAVVCLVAGVTSGAAVLATRSGHTTTGTAVPRPRLAPTVPAPVDATRFLVDPCTALSPRARTSIGLDSQELEERDPGPGCSWAFTMDGDSWFGYWLLASNTGGLDDIYWAPRTGWAYFEPVEVLDHPAVLASITDERHQGRCVLIVGLSNQLAMQVTVELSPRLAQGDACTLLTAGAGLFVGGMRGLF